MTLREQFIDTLASILGVRNKERDDIEILKNTVDEITNELIALKQICNALFVTNPNVRILNTDNSSSYDDDDEHEEDEDFDEKKRNMN